MDRSPKELGLSPDILRLPSEVRCLIRDGSSNGHLVCSKTIVAVRAMMIQAGFGVDEVWMVLTPPTNGISNSFFSLDGEQAEDYLECLVAEADEASRRRYGEGGSG